MTSPTPERNEIMEHLRTFHTLLEAEARDKDVTGKLWKTDLDGYGSPLEGAEKWISEGAGIKRAADMLKKTFGF